MYRADLVPHWVWIILAIGLLLVLLVLLSTAASRSYRDVVLLGPEVETGRPEDFVQKPPAAPAPSPKAAPPTAPPALPDSFTYQGIVWISVAGPMEINVLTTGDLTDDHIIYRKQGDEPPYEALYLETAPNSGVFYKYVPATTE